MDEILWVEKFRPQKVDDCILPNEIKETFKTFVANDSIPNLLLSGGPGCGKTTAAKAMLNEVGADFIMINGSLDMNVDKLRNDIATFASTVSFSNTRKFVILDEADYMNAQYSQAALRNFMEEFSKNCGFIFTCNYKNRIIEPLRSRCSVVDFKIPTSEKKHMALEFLHRLEYILTKEGIEYDKSVLGAFIVKHFPDWRRVINELQRYSASGRIDENILVDFGQENVKELIEHLRSKDFDSMRKWVHANSDVEATAIFRSLYDYAIRDVDGAAKAVMIVTLSKYQYQHAFVADPEINLVACFLEIMTDCDL